MFPHDFILEFLYPLSVTTKKMFGNTAIYLEDKIILATRQKEENAVDNGIWVGTELAHHKELKVRIPELKHLETYRIKKWLLLHEDETLFEERARELCELIKSDSKLIGVIPKTKKKK